MSVYNYSVRPNRPDYIPINKSVTIPDEDSVATLVNKFLNKNGPQYLVTFIASIGTFGHATSLAWSALALPNMHLLGDFDLWEIDSNMATWIGAITPLGCFFSGFVYVFLVQHIGRKGTLVASGLPFTLGWLCIALSLEVKWILVGRFLTGFCGAGILATSIIYISEVSEFRIRGFLCTSVGISGGLGTLFTYIIGTYFDWRSLCLLSSIFPLVFTFGAAFLPESPQYLISQNRNHEAKESLRWLRGTASDIDITDEIHTIKACLQAKHDTVTLLVDLLSLKVLKPIGLCFTLMLFQQLGGLKAVMFYLVDILESAGTDIDAHLSAIIIATMQVFFLFLSTAAVERCGRRLLLIASELGIAISLAFLGMYFYLKGQDAKAANNLLGWLPLTSLIFYKFSYSIGMGPVVWTLLGELSPPHIKGLNTSMAATFCYGLTFLITKFFPDLQIALTIQGCYWFFSASSIVGLLFCYFFVPETKGKQFNEIQYSFTK